jgi:predicted nucleic acid-binding protein
MRYMLDSTFVIDYLRDDAIAVARFAQVFADGDEAVINEIVVCEVRAGLPDAVVAAFDALLEPTEFVQPGPDTAMRAGQWRVESRRRGRVLSLGDALIAATAEATNAAVLTRNLRDFALTPVRVESY